MIFIKDVDGLYTDDPKTHPDADLIHEISIDELVRRKLPTLPIEPSVLDLMRNARLTRSVRLINGLVSGNLTRALAGEAIGTLIRV
jgi:molybdenum storage protein